MISQRYAKANNSYLDDYDSSERNNYLIYLDANNLYGWSMSQSLPTHVFRWLSDEDISAFNVQNVAENSEEGYI